MVQVTKSAEDCKTHSGLVQSDHLHSTYIQSVNVPLRSCTQQTAGSDTLPNALATVKDSFVVTV